jgi:hypothetical protein
MTSRGPDARHHHRVYPSCFSARLFLPTGGFEGLKADLKAFERHM